ncbi:MAG: hydrogenase expression/formation protein HypE [Sandaracinus sp.]|nr:hydrogenase expression/formation protein HypE [Sandaracinus sp.]
MEGLSCPVPWSRYERVTLAHGGGGRLTRQLVDQLFKPAFESPELEAELDGARLALGGPVAVTTDAFTVRPLVFPGGDIGSLAVHGSVNDLAMCGARPRALTASFVLEEGLPLATLERLVRSMGEAARAAGVRVVAGDTKVVERGKGDGVYIAVTALGETLAEVGPDRIEVGDRVLLSGPVGDHGTAVLLAREGLPLPEGLVSDSADVSPAALALLEAGLAVRCLRDPTRGGLATVAAELAAKSGHGVRLDAPLPVRPEVADACELVGLDPLYVACEGRFVAFVAPEDAERALAILRAHEVARGAPLVGEVVGEHPGVATLRSELGAERVLDLLSGEPLPRIC